MDVAAVVGGGATADEGSSFRCDECGGDPVDGVGANLFFCFMKIPSLLVPSSRRW
uniref:Uncharacterized protein n=1 Tax=Arundo donax TaxID=35708 RepID=A0A0A9A970_ARUDO